MLTVEINGRHTSVRHNQLVKYQAHKSSRSVEAKNLRRVPDLV